LEFSLLGQVEKEEKKSEKKAVLPKKEKSGATVSPPRQSTLPFSLTTSNSSHN